MSPRSPDKKAEYHKLRQDLAAAHATSKNKTAEARAHRRQLERMCLQELQRSGSDNGAETPQTVDELKEEV